MKKSLLVLMLLTVLSPVWGLYCQYCGKTVADDARFCPMCGKGVISAPAVPAGNDPIKPQQSPVVGVGDITAVVPVHLQTLSLFNDYEAVNRLEMLLTSTTTLPPSSKVAERRFLAAQAVEDKSKDLGTLSQVSAKAHALMVRKMDTLDQYFEAWKSSINGPMKAQGLAQKEKLSFSLSKINEMIASLKTQGNDQAILARLDKQENELNEASQNFQVTSSFMRVDKGKLNKGQPFWIAETKNGWARIIGMGENTASMPVSGWVSLYELSQRTTWKGEIPVVQYQVPVNPVVMYPPVQYEPSVVIIGHGDCWPFPYHHRRHDGRSFGRHRRRR